MNDMISNDLTEDERIILKLIINSERKYTKQEMADIIGKSVTTVNRVIKRLTQKSLIERVGSNKTGYWKVVQ